MPQVEASAPTRMRWRALDSAPASSAQASGVRPDASRHSNSRANVRGPACRLECSASALMQQRTAASEPEEAARCSGVEAGPSLATKHGYPAATSALKAPARPCFAAVRTTLDASAWRLATACAAGRGALLALSRSSGRRANTPSSSAPLSL